MPAFALYDPDTEMYYCDEPYIELPVLRRGWEVLETKPMVWGCAVDRPDWATRYPTHGRARIAQGEAGHAFTEIVML